MVVGGPVLIGDGEGALLDGPDVAELAGEDGAGADERVLAVEDDEAAVGEAARDEGAVVHDADGGDGALVRPLQHADHFHAAPDHDVAVAVAREDLAALRKGRAVDRLRPRDFPGEEALRSGRL